MYQQGEVIQSRYEVKEVFLGGMGIVYITYDRTDNKFLALKTIQPQFHLKLSSMERFVREAKIWIALGSHPNIVKVHRIEQIEGLPYIFMECVIGTPQLGSNLRGWILKRAVDIVFALDVALQVCAGLSHAQLLEPGLVHRDIKPENLLIDTHQTVKIADFGLAKALEEDLLEVIPNNLSQEPFQTSLTRTGRVVGTPPYMSPEQCYGIGEIDFRSDIYSLGCILYELLAGEWPLDSHSPADWIVWHTTQTPHPPSTRVAGIPSYVDNIVLTCMQKQPQRRYQSYAALTEDLERAYKRLTDLRPYAPSSTPSILNDYQERMDRARAYFLVKDYKMAEVEIESLIALDYETAEVLVNKGVVLLTQNHFSEAVQYFDRALEVDSSSNVSVRALINKAHAKIRLAKYEDGISILNNVLYIKPDSWEAWGGLGDAYFLAGNNNEALRCYDKSLSLTPWNSSAWINRGIALNRLGRASEAELSYAQGFRYSISFRDRAEMALQLAGKANLMLQDEELFAAAHEALRRSENSIRIDITSSEYLMFESLCKEIGMEGSFIAATIKDPQYIRFVRQVILDVNLIGYHYSADHKVTARDLLDRLVESISIFESAHGNKMVLGKAPLKASFLYTFLGLTLSSKNLNEFSLEILQHLEQRPVIVALMASNMIELQRWDDALIYLDKCLKFLNEDFPILLELTREDVEQQILLVKTMLQHRDLSK